MTTHDGNPPFLKHPHKIYLYFNNPSFFIINLSKDSPLIITIFRFTPKKHTNRRIPIVIQFLNPQMRRLPFLFFTRCRKASLNFLKTHQQGWKHPPLYRFLPSNQTKNRQRVARDRIPDVSATTMTL